MWRRKKANEIDRQFDEMINRVAEGKLVPFEEWLELETQVDEEADRQNEEMEHIDGVPGWYTLEEVQAKAEEDKAMFLATLERFGLSLKNRFDLCYCLCELAEETPSVELLRVFCDIASGNPYLLDLDRTSLSEEEYIQEWNTCKEYADALYEHLSGRARQAKRYQRLLKEVKDFHPKKEAQSSEPSAVQERIFQTFIQLYDLQVDEAKKMRFLDNITYLLQLADSSQALKVLKPLFLYQAITRHRKRLLNTSDLHIDVGALWKTRIYKIEEHNGKNYLAYWKQLELFSQLCSILEKSEDVDLAICVYGFDRLSNLGEFYRMGAKTEHEIPFEPTMEDLMLESSFSCFEHGYQDNLVLVDSGYSHRQLDKFMCNKKYHHAFVKLDKYMNHNVVDLANQFLKANQESKQVKALCQKVLELANLSAKDRPKTMDEVGFFLSAINEALMDVVDGFADDYLQQAGWALSRGANLES